MNPLNHVKDEYIVGSSDEVPQPMEGLNEIGPPPFLTKIYEMVDDPNTEHIVSWSRGGQSFGVWDPHAFSTTLLPTNFKHNNFSSFVRQLNTYGFRKSDPDKWEFSNGAFLMGQKHLLRTIKRRKAQNVCLAFPPQQQVPNPCLEVGRFGLDSEIKRLRRDKQALMMELVKLRQQQQSTRAHLDAMELRLQGTEKRQQQMLNFLAKAMLQKNKMKEIEEETSKKRRRPMGFGDFSYVYDQVSELETLALEMQGFGRAMRRDTYNESSEEVDDSFWEELFDEGFEERLAACGK